MLHIEDDTQQPNGDGAQVAAYLQQLVLQYLPGPPNPLLRYLVGRYLTAERIEWFWQRLESFVTNVFRSFQRWMEPKHKTTMIV